MKIRLIVEKIRKQAHVSFTQREIRDLYDWFYICSYCEKCDRRKRINKIKIDSSLFKKFEHIIHYIIDEGRSYELKNGERHLCKEEYYFVKKPKWS